jgi:hypothetical protein
MSIKYDTSGDMFTVRVYSFPEGKRDAQCEMILMNAQCEMILMNAQCEMILMNAQCEMILMNEDEGQVAQRLTTLAADGMNLESRVCR